MRRNLISIRFVLLCVCVLTTAQLSRDGLIGDAEEATASPLVDPKEQEVVKKILDNQYKCFERMNREPQYNKSGGDRQLQREETFC